MMKSVVADIAKDDPTPALPGRGEGAGTSSFPEYTFSPRMVQGANTEMLVVSAS